MNSVYSPLYHHLSYYRPVEVVYYFKDIEKIIGRKLPSSAYEHQWWWSSHDSYTQYRNGWGAANYDAVVDLEKQKVRFEHYWLS